MPSFMRGSSSPSSVGGIGFTRYQFATGPVPGTFDTEPHLLDFADILGWQFRTTIFDVSPFRFVTTGHGLPEFSFSVFVDDTDIIARIDTVDAADANNQGVDVIIWHRL